MPHKFNPENPFKSRQSELETAVDAPESMGLRIEHFFSTPGVHPFEQLEWETRSAKITDDNEQVIFEQDNIEVPISWSQLATKVVASKYFYGDNDSGRREHSVKQLVHRVCKTIADRGRKDGYFATDEGLWRCRKQTQFPLGPPP
jgi:ribonucleoside-diphosphate reductase alpha chain